MNKSNQTSTILVVGGGSGGHLTPLLILARELKSQSPDCNLTYVGFKGEKLGGILKPALFDKIAYINAGKFRRYPLSLKVIILNLRDVFRLLAGIWQSWWLIGKLKPDVIFSKGGFVALPIVLMSRLRRIPLITHDSDSVPGLANRVSAKWAAAHATGMPPDLYSYPRYKTVYTGVPVSSDFFKAWSSSQIAQLKLAHGIGGKQVLLVMGGSLGAGYINESLPQISEQLLDQCPSLSIVHITGERYFETAQSDYKNLLPANKLKRIKILSFTDKLAELEAVADLVVARAGATSIAELAAISRATVIIPSPFVSSGHQLKNAEWLRQNESSVIIENGSSPHYLADAIISLLSDSNKREKLSGNIHKLAKPKAASELAKLILKFSNWKVR